MTLIGSKLLIEAQKLLGEKYTEVRCHDLILLPFLSLDLFEEKVESPGVPENVHETIEDFNIQAYLQNYANMLKPELDLSWLDNWHYVEPGDILLLGIAGSSPCHLAWAASPRGRVRHMLHAWNPDPSRPQIGSVRYDLVHPRIFHIHHIARINEV